MHAEPETHRSSWLAYAAVAVALPALYVLSSGPAQCIERTETGSFTIGKLFDNDGPNIPFRQGSFRIGCAKHWTPLVGNIYRPLTWVANNAVPGRVLNWYWNLFGERSHILVIFDSEIVNRDISAEDDSEEETAETSVEEK